MTKFKIIKGDSVNIAVHNVRIELADGSFYLITDKDKICFALSLRNKPLIVKTFPGEMKYINGEIVVLKLEPIETRNLNCLSYNFEFKIDIGGIGTQVYTISRGNIEVISSAEVDSG